MSIECAADRLVLSRAADCAERSADTASCALRLPTSYQKERHSSPISIVSIVSYRSIVIQLFLVSNSGLIHPCYVCPLSNDHRHCIQYIRILRYTTFGPVLTCNISVSVYNTIYSSAVAGVTNQGWQVVAKSGLNHWFLPVKTGWQKMWVAKSGKK